MKTKISILFVLLTISVGYGQNSNLIGQLIETNKDSIGFLQIKTNSIFNILKPNSFSVFMLVLFTHNFIKKHCSNLLQRSFLLCCE
jgi:hypothetical protein